jgi:hypothetical protein
MIWRLLAITMPLSILGIALVGNWLLGLLGLRVPGRRTKLAAQIACGS